MLSENEFFNILNHPNFANPTNMLTTGLFGRATQTLANGLGSGGANGGSSATACAASRTTAMAPSISFQ